MLTLRKVEKNSFQFGNLDNYKCDYIDLENETSYFASLDSIYPQLARIVKINENGIVLRYFNDSKQVDNDGTLDLLKTGFGFQNQSFNYLKISDNIVDNSSHMELRECELHFSNINDDQLNSIESFINNIDDSFNANLN